MFVAVGCDWTTEIMSTKDAWCDSIYIVVRGTGKKARVMSIHGSEEMLQAWLSHEHTPVGKYTVLHVDAKTFQLRVLKERR